MQKQVLKHIFLSLLAVAMCLHTAMAQASCKKKRDLISALIPFQTRGYPMGSIASEERPRPGSSHFYQLLQTLSQLIPRVRVQDVYMKLPRNDMDLYFVEGILATERPKKNKECAFEEKVLESELVLDDNVTPFGEQPLLKCRPYGPYSQSWYFLFDDVLKELQKSQLIEDYRLSLIPDPDCLNNPQMSLQPGAFKLWLKYKTWN